MNNIGLVVSQEDAADLGAFREDAINLDDVLNSEVPDQEDDDNADC